MARKTLVPPREPRIKTFSFLPHKWIETLARKNNPMRDSLRDRAKKLENKFSDLFNRGKISMLEFGIFRNFIQRERERERERDLRRRFYTRDVIQMVEFISVWRSCSFSNAQLRRKIDPFAGESGKTDSWKTRVKIGFLNGCRWINARLAVCVEIRGRFIFILNKKKETQTFISLYPCFSNTFEKPRVFQVASIV